MTPPNAALSGRIVIRFNDAVQDELLALYAGTVDANAVKIRTLAEVAETLPQHGVALPGLDDFLSRSPALRSWRLVAPEHLTLVQQLEAQAVHSPFPPIRSLLSYYVIETAAQVTGLGLRELLAELRRPQLAAYVDFAILEPKIRPASPCLPSVTSDNATWAVSPDPSRTSPSQPNLRGIASSPALWGVNVNCKEVWGCYDGTGVGFADLELGWDFVHNDLQLNPATSVVWPPSYDLSKMGSIDHGTKDLGIVLGRDNSSGIVGIAPRCMFRGCVSPDETAKTSQPGPSDQNISGAILGALAVLQRGDVLLIELEAMDAMYYDGWPVELHAPWFDSVRLASGTGRVVIEAGGNGGNDLDVLSSVGPNDPLVTVNLTRSSPGFTDSGAIMVTASDSAESGPPLALGHARGAGYAKGSRIDCGAWGELVKSAMGIGKGTGTHNGTSAAAAQIAGCAVLAQQMALKNLGAALSPQQLRAVLSAPANGTPIFDAGEEVGGVRASSTMPDMALVVAAIETLSDVFVRDSLGDDGTEPITPFVSQSPDIICRTSGSTTDLMNRGAMPASEDVQPNVVNNVTVRLHNRRVNASAATTATVYWADTSTMVLPIDLHRIGTTPPLVVPGATVVGGSVVPAMVVSAAIPWTPTAGNHPQTHGCFVAVVDDPADPAPLLPVFGGTSATAADIHALLSWIGQFNNIAFRNFDVYSLAAEGNSFTARAEFFARALPWRKVPFGFDIDVDLPAESRLDLHVRPEFAAALAAAIRPGRQVKWDGARGTIAFTLGAAGRQRFSIDRIVLPADDGRERCAVRIALPADAPRRTYQVRIRQRFRERYVGALTLSIPKRD